MRWNKEKDLPMSDKVDNGSKIDLQTVIDEVLSMIEQNREREIIVRRFGLYDRRETLEQIGNCLELPESASDNSKKLSSTD